MGRVWLLVCNLRATARAPLHGLNVPNRGHSQGKNPDSCTRFVRT